MKSFRFFSLSDLWVAISSSKSKRKVYWNNLLKPLLILNECVRFEEMSLGDDIYLTLPTIMYIPGALCTFQVLYVQVPLILIISFTL